MYKHSWLELVLHLPFGKKYYNRGVALGREGGGVPEGQEPPPPEFDRSHYCQPPRFKMLSTPLYNILTFLPSIKKFDCFLSFGELVLS